MSQLKFEIKHFWKESRKRAILPIEVIIFSIEVIQICNCTFFHFYSTALALNATLWEERSCSKSQGAIFWYNIYIYIFANLYYIPYVFHHEIYFQITILIFALHSEIIFIFCCKKCIFEKHFVLYILIYIYTIGILIGLWPFFKKISLQAWIVSSNYQNTMNKTRKK